MRDIWPVVLRVFAPSGQGFKDLDVSQEAAFVVQREKVIGAKSRALGMEGGRGEDISEEV